MDHEETVNAVIAALQGTAAWKFLEHQMAASESEQKAEEAATAPDPSEAPPPAAEAAGPEKDDMAGGSCPTATNVAVPGPIKARKPGMEEPDRYSALASDVTRYQAEVTGLKAQIDAQAAAITDLTAINTRSTRKAELAELAAREEIFFEIDEEVERVSRMSAADYESHKTLMVTRYARAPIGGDFTPTATSNRRAPGTTGGAHGKTAEQVRAAVSMATSQGIPYEDALLKV